MAEDEQVGLRLQAVMFSSTRNLSTLVLAGGNVLGTASAEKPAK